MAQTKRYHLAGTTDLSNIASWHDGVYGASAVPLASNVVIFAEGNDNIVSGLSTLNLALAQVQMTQGFSGRLGTAGTSATIAANTNGGSTEYGVDGSTSSGVEKFIYGAGGGYAYVAIGSGGIDVVRSDSNGKLYLTTGTVNTRLEHANGYLSINDQVVLSSTSVELYGGQSDIDYKDDATNATLIVNGGTHFIKRAMGAITINGGYTTIQVEKEAAMCSGAITLNGGTLDLRAGNFPAVTVQFNGGTLITSKAVRPLDWSSASLIVLGNTDMDLAGAGSKITWPATSAVQVKSGRAAQSYARVAATAT